MVLKKQKKKSESKKRETQAKKKETKAKKKRNERKRIIVNSDDLKFKIIYMSSKKNKYIQPTTREF